MIKILTKLFSLLDYIYYKKCYLCGKKALNSIVCDTCFLNICEELEFEKNKYKNIEIYSAAVYSKNFQKIIRAIKYHKKSEFAKILAEGLFKMYKNFNEDLSEYTICAVPIHKNRFKKRKYNHMELIGEEFSHLSGLNFDFNIIKRIKDTPPLYKYKSVEREKILQDAFFVEQDLSSKKILLIDDIVTTGTTIKNIVNELKKANCKDIKVFCITQAHPK